MQPIPLADKLATFTAHWSPRIVGSFNGHDLMVVKVLGEFVWHDHPDTCLLYTSPSPRDRTRSRMPSSA